MNTEILELVGKTLTRVENDNDELIFYCDNGEKFKLYHSQECCESVTIDDIDGDLNDLVGSPILVAEEVSNNEFVAAFDSKFVIKNDSGYEYKEYLDGSCGPDSYTWTFYKFATTKGYVNVRWYGESNGYYSESVDFQKADLNGIFDRY